MRAGVCLPAVKNWTIITRGAQDLLQGNANLGIIARTFFSVTRG